MSDKLFRANTCYLKQMTDSRVTVAVSLFLKRITETINLIWCIFKAQLGLYKDSLFYIYFWNLQIHRDFWMFIHYEIMKLVKSE